MCGAKRHVRFTPESGHQHDEKKGRPCGSLANDVAFNGGAITSRRHFLAFCHIANLRTAFAVAGICLVFFSGISRGCDEHGYCQGSEQSCKQFHCFPPMNVVAQRLVV